MAARPISNQARPGETRTGCIVAFLGVFALIGFGILFLLYVRPLASRLISRSWQETPCVILSSRINGGPNWNSYASKVEVLYAYSVNGRSYQSGRYGFDDWAYPQGRAEEEILAELSPGTRTSCWIDPADPSRAVLRRDFHPVFIVGLAPFLFLAVGIGGGWTVLASARRAARKSVVLGPASAFGVQGPADGSGPMELRPTATPLGKLVGLILFSLFWNGLLSVFVVLHVSDWKEGHHNGCVTAFLTPFVLIGLLLIFATLRQFLVLFNPRVHLRLTPGSPGTGSTAFVEWRLSGRGGGVRRLRVVLEGREEAQYRRGTSTYTDRNVFAKIQVVDTAQSFEISAGNARLDIPVDAVPSFKGDHNKIIWSLKVACEIRDWPDSDDEYEVAVRPGAGSGAFS